MHLHPGLHELVQTCLEGRGVGDGQRQDNGRRADGRTTRPAGMRRISSPRALMILLRASKPRAWFMTSVADFSPA